MYYFLALYIMHQVRLRLFMCKMCKISWGLEMTFHYNSFFKVKTGQKLSDKKNHFFFFLLENHSKGQFLILCNRTGPKPSFVNLRPHRN